MEPKAMEPQGLALRAYFEGDLDAELIIHRDDGVDDALRVSHFFRNPSEFTAIETGAIDLCSGHVLDAGAGTGLHSLVLQKKGVAVTVIDISPQAAVIMARRGVKDVHCADIFRFNGGPFTTVLMLGHGIGMVETIAGLGRFLSHAHGLVAKNGQVLLDSQDVRLTDDPRHLAYHEANRRAGRYIGEIRLRLSFRGKTGPRCGWLHVDPNALREQAEATGWSSTLIRQEESGHYLARLERLQVGSQNATEVFTRESAHLRLQQSHPNNPTNLELARERRALKKVILHHQNALSYKSENGAHVGDLFMSLVYTCELCGTNPFDYLTELQRRILFLYHSRSGSTQAVSEVLSEEQRTPPGAER